MNTTFLRYSITATALSAAFTISVNAANAEPSTGTYIALSGYTSSPEDYTTTASSTRKTKRGHRLSIAAGYGFNNMRIEGELSQLQTPPKSTSHPLVNGGAETPMSGSITSRMFMLNGYYDFELDGPFTPYVGGGAGFAKQTIDLNAPGFPSASSSDTIIPWQVMVGTAYEITNALDITAEFRYFDTTDPTFTSSGGTTYTVKGDAMQQIGIGLRLRF